MAGRKHRDAPREITGDQGGVRATGPVEFVVVRQFAHNLKEAMAGRSGREVGRLCGVDHTTVNKILAGGVWPDFGTVVRLEAGLGVDLWPRGLAADLGLIGEDADSDEEFGGTVGARNA